MKKVFLLAGYVLACTLIKAQSSDTSRSDASINNATVYFGYGAELIHEAKVKVSPGTKTIVINQLSTNMDVGSLQVSCPEEITLLAQKFNVFYPGKILPVKSKEVEKWEDSIQILQKSISRLDNNISIEREILTKTGVLIESALASNGNKAVLSTEVLKLVDYYNARIERSKNTIYHYQQEINEHNKKVELLRKKINNASAPSKDKPYGQVILQVMVSKATEIPVSISYYTHHAGWTPVYDIRVNSKTNKVKLVYKASLTQTTGIDWKKTKLTLSTGTPNFGVAAPILNAWYLQLYVPGIYTDLQRRAATGNAMRNQVQSYYENDLKEVIVTDDKAYKQEYRRDSVMPVTLQDYTTLNEGQLNTNFEIDLPYDIESDGQMHGVSIKDEEIECILKNYAVPRADKEAYLLAEVANWQNLDLLPGEANIIMDNTYIGKSIIDPNTTADTLNLPLGKDRRLAIKRSLVKELSSLKTAGKESKQTFTYEIVVKNNKLTDVNLLLKDQHPLSTIKEVEVELGEASGAMINPETGVLTWKIELKPGESKKVRFSYTVKYPKDKKIINLK